MKENKAEEKKVDFLSRWTSEYNFKEIPLQFIIKKMHSRHILHTSTF